MMASEVTTTDPVHILREHTEMMWGTYTERIPRALATKDHRLVMGTERGPGAEIDPADQSVGTAALYLYSMI